MPDHAEELAAALRDAMSYFPTMSYEGEKKRWREVLEAYMASKPNEESIRRAGAIIDRLDTILIDIACEAAQNENSRLSHFNMPTWDMLTDSAQDRWRQLMRAAFNAVIAAARKGEIDG